MGLFSRKKKELKVPTPPSDDVLKFPKPSQAKKELPPPPEHPSPEKIKEAVGVEKPEEMPPDKIEKDDLPPPKLPEESESPQREMPPLPEPFTPPERPSFITNKPFFLRMPNYQMILDNLNDIKNKTIEMDKLSEDIEKSEYNENKNYEHLKKDLKKIHDSLLSIDDQIFKK